MMGARKFPGLLSLLSGVLLGISMVTLNEWLTWIALVPLIIAIEGKSIKKTIINATVCGITYGIISLAWMPKALHIYAGISFWFGLTGMLAIAIIVTAWYAGLFSLYAFLRKTENENNRQFWFNLLVFVAVFQIVAFIRLQILPGFIWDKFDISAALSRNQYMIQLASVIGILGIGTLIAGVNFLLAHAFLQKKILYLYFALVLFAGNLLYGSITYHQMTPAGQGGKRIGIVCENIAAETRWTESGDAIISTILRLVDASVAYKPDLLVWSETALPWTYKDNDDILLAVADIIKQSNKPVQQIIGYLSMAENDTTMVYNSAYLINESGKPLGRVDKYQLLTFFEEPLISADSRTAIPMLTQSVYDNMKRGDGNKLMNTAIGTAWVMICNESLLPVFFDKSVTEANYLVNISNDAWLEDTQNIAHHFYLARLKAVEYRKDLVINSNRGISGLINKRGQIVIKNMSDKPELLTGELFPNELITFYARIPWLIPMICFVVVCIYILYKFVYLINHSKPKIT